MTFDEWWSTLPSPALPEYDDAPLKNVARMAWEASRQYVPGQSVLEAMRAARDALAICYEVQSYPGDGKTVQDGAIAQLDAAISSCEKREGEAP
jgi:hypothetical protein